MKFDAKERELLGDGDPRAKHDAFDQREKERDVPVLLREDNERGSPLSFREESRKARAHS